MLVGDVKKPMTASSDNLYHKIITEERKAKNVYFITAVITYTAIAAQVILCLCNVIGAQAELSRNRSSNLAAVNNGVAGTIGVFKGLGLPDKKAVERGKLQKVAEKARTMTRKLRGGLEVAPAQEVEGVREMYEQAEGEASWSCSLV